MIPAPLTLVTALGAMRVTMPEDLRPAENRRAVLNMLRVRSRQQSLTTERAFDGNGQTQANWQSAWGLLISYSHAATLASVMTLFFRCHVPHM